MGQVVIIVMGQVVTIVMGQVVTIVMGQVVVRTFGQLVPKALPAICVQTMTEKTTFIEPRRVNVLFHL